MQFLPVKLLSNIILVDSRLRGLLEELYPAVPDDGTMALIEMANLILDEFLKMSNLTEYHGAWIYHLGLFYS
jgi:hypothetical protein